DLDLSSAYEQLLALSAASHRRHGQLLSAAAALGSLRTIAEAQILGKAKPLASQPTAIAFADNLGLALMKASWTGCGVTLSGSLRSVNSGGIFTAARALRTVSKKARGD